MIYCYRDGVRADRLVSIILLLRQRGQMSADKLAAELEVTPRTILRDIEALSTAGVPVYAERGRHGGFSLLPGFRSELAGLNTAEALALVTAASSGGGSVFGQGKALAAAMLKVADALPDAEFRRVSQSAKRLLIEPTHDLLSRRAEGEPVADVVLNSVREAVVDRRQLRIYYQASGAEANWRTVDPIGLVTVRGNSYLLAVRAGQDRTYKLARILAAEVSEEASALAEEVDLEAAWEQRRKDFLSAGFLTVHLRVKAQRRNELLKHVVSLENEQEAEGEWSSFEVTFNDLAHAVWAVWQLDTDAEVESPEDLRDSLRKRAESLERRYQSPHL